MTWLGESTHGVVSKCVAIEVSLLVTTAMATRNELATLSTVRVPSACGAILEVKFSERLPRATTRTCLAFRHVVIFHRREVRPDMKVCE